MKTMTIKKTSSPNEMRAAMLLAGITSRQIAKQFGVSDGYISRVIHGTAKGSAAEKMRQQITEMLSNK